jgi:hypothetical protein
MVQAALGSITVTSATAPTASVPAGMQRTRGGRGGHMRMIVGQPTLNRSTWARA